MLESRQQPEAQSQARDSLGGSDIVFDKAKKRLLESNVEAYLSQIDVSSGRNNILMRRRRF